MLQDLAAAFGLLTRLPFGRLAPDGTDYARAVWAYPVAGAAVGLLGAIAYALCARIGLPPAIAAFWTLAAMVLITGALTGIGMFNALVMSYSRLPLAMAEDGMLPAIVARYRRAGYRFVTVGELLRFVTPEQLNHPLKNPLAAQ